MLSLFILHLVTLVSCTLAGFVFYRLFQAAGDRPLVMYFISGLILLTLITQVLILFVPLNAWTRTGIALAVLLMLAYYRQGLSAFITATLKQLRQLPAGAWICITSLWIMILIMNAGATTSDDTESYHIQMVKWIREYGTVPGLVHLHMRYGFNSSWFSDIALFSITSGKLNFYTSLNATLSLVLGIYLVNNLFSLRKPGLAAPSFMVLALCLLSWPLIRGNSPSSGYDFITAVIVLVLFMETVRPRHEQSVKPGLQLEYITWTAFLFTVRITNFPMLILLVAGVIQLLRIRPARALLPVVFAALLVIPFLVRNVILSGFAFYPSMAVDLFSFDWKADPDRTNKLLHFIKMFNRVSPQFQEIGKTATLTTSQWIPLWMKYMFPFDKIIVFPGMAGLLLAPFFVKRLRMQSAAAKLLLVTLFAQALLWMLVAPDARFLYGPLLCGSALLIMIACSFFQGTDRIWIPAATLGCLLYAGYTLYSRKNELKQTIVYPTPLPSPPLEIVTVDGIRLAIPGKAGARWSPRCFDTELPCVYEVTPGIRARGTTIADGFKLTR